jgi:Cft2 family RNA processing exonuclease
MTQELEIAFHGAARTVTGSCMELTLGSKRILIDCGLFQGSRSLEALNHGAFAFAPDQVDAVVLTHAHIDHCGLLPKLVAQGFAGPVFCTEQTADLLEFMLADAGRIQEYEAALRNGSNRWKASACGCGMPGTSWARPLPKWRRGACACSVPAISARNTRHSIPIQRLRPGSIM